jgi:hypothetical protein
MELLSVDIEGREELKLLCIALIAVVLAGDCMGRNFSPRSSTRQLTDADLQAARQVAIDFTSDFVRTADLSTVIKDRFSNDFIERYTKAKSKEGTSSDVYFVPGLSYSSRLLVEAGPEDWLRFYSAANNFIFFGFMAALKNSANANDIDATKLYPSAVINLLNTNATLSNMIIRKGRSTPVSSVEDMRQATSILEQALSVMREQKKGQAPFKINEQELIKVMREDDFFAPKVVTVDERFFGLPQGTQVIFIKTPILFQLTLMKTNNNKFEILWAEPDTDG